MARAGAPLRFFIFDLLILNGKDVMGDPLMKRRELIEEHVLPMLAEPIRYSPILDATYRLNGIAGSADGTRIWVTVTGNIPGAGYLRGAVLELAGF